jgi:hypothetical protein
MRLIHLLIRRAVREDGFTMAAIMLGGAVMGLLVVVAATAAKGDLGVTQRDLDHKQAYEAAQAGIADYAFHLNQDTNYWTRCTNVPSPSAVNQQDSITKTRPVPGNTGATYAIQLIPRTGRTTCDPNNAVDSMIEQGTATSGTTGTFRIRSVGFSGGSKVSLVATFKRASFLDYLYFTQLETSDPVVYTAYNYQPLTDGAYAQCSKSVQQGRYDQPFYVYQANGQSFPFYCDKIYFITGETIRGPLHTNDEFYVCGTPTFGRSAADAIEASAPPPGYHADCSSGGNPNFVGTFVTRAPVLTPPPTNRGLRTTADPAYRFTGQTKIVLGSSNMTVTPAGQTARTLAYPSNGVIYISNGACSASYSPFTAPTNSSPPDTTCGNAVVSGTLSDKLTIAAENDIIVTGNIQRTSDGLLGLIANNFVRVYHPCTDSNNTNGAGAVSNLRIDAAILAIQHSFIVDHYNCGASLGSLTVNGAIAQKYRGAVGTFGSAQTGYSKQYSYDDRLRYISPPHFLDPVESAWHVQRETVDP